MSRQIPEEIIQEIRERTDIVEVVSSYLPLKRSGANNQGLCPFHSEKSPSFNVNSTRQIFHCFGCGVGGNVFTFLMRMEGLAFPEAVRRLAEKAGVDVPDEEMSPAEEQRQQERDKLARINEVAADYYHQLLLDSDGAAPARRYLRQRGFDADAVRFFRLGYATDQWEGLARHLQAKGFDPKVVRDQLGLTRAGKDGREDYDLFRKRLMIPILDVRDQVVAFGGRVLDDSLPKYINSPESPIYHKSRVLYGLNGAREALRRENFGIIVEGYFDQMALHRAGFENTVATCGTALTPDHAKLLKRYTDRLLMLFDQDKAGRQATLRSMDVLLPAGISVAVVTLKEGADPDSFLSDHGREAMQDRLAAAQPILEYYIDLTLEQCAETVEGQARAVEAIAAKLKLLQSDIERDLYIKAVCERTGLDAALLRNRIASAARPEQKPAAPQPPVAVAAPPGIKVPAAVDRAQKDMLRMILEQHVSAAELTGADLDRLFPTSGYRAIARQVVRKFTADGEVAVPALQDGLEADAAELLASLFMEAMAERDEEPVKVFNDGRAAVEQFSTVQQRRALPQLIQAAEARGDFEQVARLQQEILTLKKSEKKL